MSNVKKLEDLIENDIILEIKENIQELNALIEKKKNVKAVSAELKNMIDVETDFTSLLQEIKSNKMSEDAAIEILEQLEHMKVDENQI